MSYTSTQYLICDNSSDANFRSWGSAISAAIAAMGWTQSGDTGQVNWTTVTAPAAGSFVYEIWQPADGGTTFYFKIEYGSNSSTPKGPRMRVSIGTTTNGSGTLTGIVTSLSEPTATTGAGQGSSIFDCYFSGDTDRLSMILWRSLGATGCTTLFFGVERTKNTDGTNSTDGVTLLWGCDTTINTGHQTLVFGVAAAGIVGGASNRGFAVISEANLGSDLAFNNNVPMSPVFPLYGKWGNPMTTFGVVPGGDVGEGCLFATSLYGATRTYVATANINWTTPGTNWKVCMRYD